MHFRLNHTVIRSKSLSTTCICITSMHFRLNFTVVRSKSLHYCICIKNIHLRLNCTVARSKTLNLLAQVGKICCINAESTILLFQCHASKPPLWGTRVSGSEVQRAKSFVFFLSILLARWARGGGGQKRVPKNFKSMLLDMWGTKVQGIKVQRALKLWSSSILLFKYRAKGQAKYGKINPLSCRQSGNKSAGKRSTES